MLDDGPLDDHRTTTSPHLSGEITAGRLGADADQSLSDADQTAGDEDASASEQDQANSEQDQQLSDRDQAAADREHEDDGPAEGAVFRASRANRQEVAHERDATRIRREHTSARRAATGESRDAVAALRDERALQRDAQAAALEASIAPIDPETARRLRDLRRQAASDRAEAARDRARAARDRAENDRARARLEAELMQAHVDDLTGAYRRSMGRTALSHEIDRARRGDGRFVVAFVDVDGLKNINDRLGHRAGDDALRTVVASVRARLRSFDPVLRYGGDEFVAGVGGVEMVEVERRFAEIADGLRSDSGIGISVGIAKLEADESVDEVIHRADAALTLHRRSERRSDDGDAA